MPTGVYLRKPLEGRFWSKVNKNGPLWNGTHCWEWIGAIIPQGYGTIGNRKTVLAHRFSYELLVGGIPEGLTIDHLCRNRRCVNPEHLEAVTLRDNLFRGENICGVNSRKTHCPKGHPYDATNTYHRPDGGRDCKICQIVRSRNSISRRRWQINV